MAQTQVLGGMPQQNYGGREMWSLGPALSNVPGLSGTSKEGGLAGLVSLFSLRLDPEEDSFMNKPSEEADAALDSSVLDVFFMLCFGVPRGEEHWAESC